MTGVTSSEHEQSPYRQRHAEDSPVKGRLIPLRTKAEVQASNETASAYVVEIPNRSANGLLNVLRNIDGAEVTNSLQHLRRFVKPEFLPRHLVTAGSGGHVIDASSETPCSVREAKSTTSHLLICLTSTVPLSALERLFQDNIALFDPLEPELRVIDVPVFAPTSAAQASEWSEKYWPTIYKNTNPYGPHPALVKRAELDLLAGGHVDRYIALAKQVASEAVDSNSGADIGAVIVERVDSVKKTRVVAIASDARYARNLYHELTTKADPPVQRCTGNVMGHAVLRAIAMVAHKRRMLARLSKSAIIHSENEISDLPPLAMEPEAFASRPLSDLENQYLVATDNMVPDGYLCLDLEIYLTHEPCVMCAMAILHSRFSRVVFEKQMPKTGALCAEDSSLGHGLFWRDQLNWKFLAWQWQPCHDQAAEGEICEDDMHA